MSFGTVAPLLGGAPLGGEVPGGEVPGSDPLGGEVPGGSSEAVSTAAQMLVFSPFGDCLAGIVPLDRSRAVALAPLRGAGPGPLPESFNIPLVWELRWRQPGAAWAEWARALPSSATGGAPPGMWWRVGIAGAPIPCDVELRCRATFPLLSPAGGYALSQPVSVAVWTDPAPMYGGGPRL